MYFSSRFVRVRLVSIPGLRWTSSMCEVPSGETTRHEVNLPAFMREGQRNKTRVSLIRLPGHGTPPGSGGSALSRAIMLHDRPRRLLYEWGFIHDSSPGHRGSAVELKGELGVILMQTLLQCCTSYEKNIYIKKKGDVSRPTEFILSLRRAPTLLTGSFMWK